MVRWIAAGARIDVRDRGTDWRGGGFGERRLWLDRNTSGPLYGHRVNLTGTIPAELGGLPKLERLVFSRNELTGTIPVELASLSELIQLSLYDNELTGGIPPELGKWAVRTGAARPRRCSRNGGPSAIAHTPSASSGVMPEARNAATAPESLKRVMTP